MKPSIVILTYNSQSSIRATLESIALLSDDIHVVDSFSTDRTVEIAQSFGAKVVTHPFENYGSQRNWAIESLPLKYGWQLHLDADERLTPALREEIAGLEAESDISGYYLPRQMNFLGKPLRHGGICPTWHLRLFQSGLGRCEARKYDQHFFAKSGPTAQLKAYMIDEVTMSVSEWTARHNRWSDAEVEEQLMGDGAGRIQANLGGTPVEKKRFWRHLYDGCPLFVRPFALFFYRYIFRLGFLDGRTGFIYYVLQTFWFRFLIDAKIAERKLSSQLSANNDLNASAANLETLPAQSNSND